MKIVVFICLIVGLIVGPGYFMYCNVFSGSTVKSYIAYDKGDQKGTLRAVRKVDMKWKPQESIKLDPSMNPIKISAAIKYLPVKVFTRKTNAYKAKLLRNGNVAWEEDFSIVLRKESKDSKEKKLMNIGIVDLKKKNVNIKTFSVEQAGEYKLDLSLLKNSEIAVSDIKVIVKSNVKIPQKGIVILGFALFVLGIVGGMVVGKTT